MVPRKPPHRPGKNVHHEKDSDILHPAGDLRRVR